MHTKTKTNSEPPQTMGGTLNNTSTGQQPTPRQSFSQRPGPPSSNMYACSESSGESVHFYRLAWPRGCKTLVNSQTQNNNAQ